jgi:hypothetical protein
MNSNMAERRLKETPDHIKGQRITGNWNWVIFGCKKSRTMLRLVHLSEDNHTDSFSIMGSSAGGLSICNKGTIQNS